MGGYLYKKRQIRICIEFQRRYFVLYDDRTVDYFKNKSYSSSRKNAEGTLHLTQIKRVEFVFCEKNQNHEQRQEKMERPRSKSLCSMMIEPFFINTNTNRKETYDQTKSYRSRTMTGSVVDDYTQRAISKTDIINPENYRINGWSMGDAVISSMMDEDVR